MDFTSHIHIPVSSGYICRLETTSGSEISGNKRDIGCKFVMVKGNGRVVPNGSQCWFQKQILRQLLARKYKHRIPSAQIRRVTPLLLPIRQSSLDIYSERVIKYGGSVGKRGSRRGSWDRKCGGKNNIARVVYSTRGVRTFYNALLKLCTGLLINIERPQSDRNASVGNS